MAFRAFMRVVQCYLLSKAVALLLRCLALPCTVYRKNALSERLYYSREKEKKNSSGFHLKPFLTLTVQYDTPGVRK